MRRACGIRASRFASRFPSLQFVEELLVASYLGHFDCECAEVGRQFAEAGQLSSDGAGRRRASGVCAVEGEVCLVQPSNWEPVPHEEEAAFLHVLFCLVDFALGQQVVHSEAGRSHFGGEVEMRLSFAGVAGGGRWRGRDRGWWKFGAVE